MFVSLLARNCTQNHTKTEIEIVVSASNPDLCYRANALNKVLFSFILLLISKPLRENRCQTVAVTSDAAGRVSPYRFTLTCKGKQRIFTAVRPPAVFTAFTVAMAIQQLQDRDPIPASKNPDEIGSFLIRVTSLDTAGILTPGVCLIVGFTQRGRKDDTRQKQKTKKKTLQVPQNSCDFSVQTLGLQSFWPAPLCCS